MKFILLFITVSFFVASSECLKCRSENDGRTIEEYEDIVRSCLRLEEENTNGHRNNRWKGNRNSSRGNKAQNGRGQQESDDDDDNGDDYDTGSSNRKNQNKRGQVYGNDRRKKKPQRDKFNSDDDDDEDYEDSWHDQNSKTKPRGSSNGSRDRPYIPQRGNEDKNYENQRGGQRHDSGYSPGSGHHNYFSSGNFRNNTNRRPSASPLENIDACIIHCMFRQMKMVNDNSMLDKFSIMSTLTRRIRDPELKEFIRDSIQECYENMDRDGGQCETTKSFAMCLDEKGRTNCEDWDLNGRGQGKRNNGRDNPYLFQPSRG